METPKEYADEVGKAIEDAIRTAGEDFNTNCPLDGDYMVGPSWAHTH